MEIMKAFGEFLGGLFLLAFYILVGALVLGLPVMWCWDYVMPQMFGLKEISLTQAIALNLLCTILVSSSSPIKFSKEKEKKSYRGELGKRTILKEEE